MEFKNLPKKAFIREVCSRDGFQSVKEQIPTDTKIKLIESMLAAGITEMEITSFVSPKAIPQLSDAAEVLCEVKKKHPGVEFTVLVPNAKGAEKAIENGADIINYVFSASESHNKANINRTVNESLAGLDEIVGLARGKAKLCVSMATAFMCPFEGRMNPDRVKVLVEAVLAKGVETISLADTIGTCNPRDFYDTLSTVGPVVGKTPVYLHVHDTFGMALLNIKVALDLGFHRFDSSIGGLGGCPFAPGAAGNVATEDLVFFLNSIGVQTGLSPEKLVEVARELEEYGLKTLGHLVVSNFHRDKKI